MANRSRAGERKPRRGQARKLSVEMLKVAFSGATHGNRATRRANLSKLKVHNRASRKGVRWTLGVRWLGIQAKPAVGEQ